MLNVSVEPINPAPGENVTYRFSYQNNGAVTLNNIVLSLTVPQYTTWNEALSTAGWTCSNGGDAGAVCTYPIGTIAPGASGEVRFVVTLDSTLPLSAQTIQLTVQVTGADQVIYAERDVVITPTLPGARQLFLPYAHR